MVLHPTSGWTNALSDGPTKASSASPPSTWIDIVVGDGTGTPHVFTSTVAAQRYVPLCTSENDEPRQPAKRSVEAATRPTRIDGRYCTAARRLNGASRCASASHPRPDAAAFSRGTVFASSAGMSPLEQQ